MLVKYCTRYRGCLVCKTYYTVIRACIHLSFSKCGQYNLTESLAHQLSDLLLLKKKILRKYVILIFNSVLGRFIIYTSVPLFALVFCQQVDSITHWNWSDNYTITCRHLKSNAQYDYNGFQCTLLYWLLLLLLLTLLLLRIM